MSSEQTAEPQPDIAEQPANDTADAGDHAGPAQPDGRLAEVTAENSLLKEKIAKIELEATG